MEPHERFVRVLTAGLLAGAPFLLLASQTVASPPAGFAAAQVARLDAEISRYRGLAADRDLIAPEPSTQPVRPGEPLASAPAVRRWLIALGDIKADPFEGAQPPVYDAALVAGVRRFQGRHGLETDGVLGPATWAALRVDPGRRLSQLQYTRAWLEATSWDHSKAMVLVNVPMFRLWAVNAASSGHRGDVALGMNVIVGRANVTPTPAIAGDMRAVIFRPVWEVPQSIIHHEILPQLARNPGYLQRQRMVLRVEPSGVVRIRQHSGDGNALGLAKFVFPNNADVYLHDTPSRALFRRARRDLSHGCVRVERPADLAAWALAGQGWTPGMVAAAMSAGPSRRVEVTPSISVVLFYATAWVEPQDGLLHFAADIYGWEP